MRSTGSFLGVCHSVSGRILLPNQPYLEGYQILEESFVQREVTLHLLQRLLELTRSTQNIRTDQTFGDLVLRIILPRLAGQQELPCCPSPILHS